MMASSLKELFNSKSRVSYAPRISVKELVAPTKLLGLKEVTSPRFGKTVAAIVQVEQGSAVDLLPGVYEVFLSRRFNDVMTPEKIKMYNEDPNLNIKFCGIGAGNEFLIEFM